MKYIKPGVYLLLLFFLVSPFLIFSRVVKVKSFECYNQYGICSDEYFTKLNVILGKTIDDAKKPVSDVFADNYLIEDYSIRLKLPSILRIDIILNKPKYALYNKDTTEIVVIDSQGYVVEKTSNTFLPLVKISGEIFDISQKIEEKKIFALEIVYAMHYLYQIKEGEIVDGGLEVTILDQIKVVFPLEGQRDVFLGSLKLILSRLNQDENMLKMGKVKEIDLRYKNPVIRYY